MSKVVQGKIVHTFGSIGRTGVAQGEVCKTCPGGCKTDCLRAGINVEKTRRRTGTYDFSINFSAISAEGLEDEEY